MREAFAERSLRRVPLQYATVMPAGIAGIQFAGMRIGCYGLVTWDLGAVVKSFNLSVASDTSQPRAQP